MIGKILGSYRILERLGEGGMGEVYLAEDLKLKRKAAIKFISASLVRDEAQRLRFVQEATLAASIDHPHIAAIYDVDQIDGQTFIAMEFVRGRTLRALLKDGPLALKRALDLAIEIAEAFAKVHQLGVTHRDLKPDNVIVSDDGYAKIIDFGLAKLIEKPAAAVDAATELQVKTADGVLLGTVAYMSPEQARGGDVDARSDIFAFGVLLYELVTGVAPFKRASSAETFSAILTEPVPPLRLRDDPAVSPELHRMIRKCTAKDRESRYQSMREVVVDLRGVREQLSAGAHATTTITPAPTQAARRSPVGIAAAVLAVAVLAWAGWHFTRPSPSSSTAAMTANAAPARPAIAVMPFELLGGGPDNAWMSGGLSSLLVTGLSQNREIQMVTRDRLDDAARQTGREKFDVVDPSSRGEVAKRAGATFVVNGTIVRVADELRIDARVEDLATGRVVLADNVRGTDPLTLADDLAARIRTRLNVQPQTQVRRVADLTSTSVEAYRLYSQATDTLENANSEDAKALYSQALKIDPDFALAYFGLFNAFRLNGQPKLAEKYLHTAAAHLERLPELEALLVRANLAVTEGRLDDARAAFDQAQGKYPESFVAAVGDYTVADAAQDSARAVAIFQRFLKAVPSSGPGWNLMGYAYLSDGRTADAVQAFQKYVQLRPTEPNSFDSLAEGQLANGELTDALTTAQRAIDAGRPSSHVTADWILATQGRLADVAVTGAPGRRLAQIIALAHQGRHHESDAMRVQLLGAARTSEDHERVVLIEALGAMLAMERGDCTAVLASVRQAMIAGEVDARANLSLTAAKVFGHLLAGTCEARTGNAAAARARLEDMRRISSPPSRTQRWWRELLEGEVALASGDAAGAATIFRRAMPERPLSFNRSGTAAYITLFSHSLILKDGLARALAAQGQIDAAIAEYRKLLDVTHGALFVGFYEPRYRLAVARLLTKQGKTADARAEYARFLEAWKQADPGSPELAEARHRG